MNATFIRYRSLYQFFGISGLVRQVIFQDHMQVAVTGMAEDIADGLVFIYLRKLAKGSSKNRGSVNAIRPQLQ
jgi:hypothetical protein